MYEYFSFVPMTVKTRHVFLILFAIGLLVAPRGGAAANVMLWDTGTRSTVENRSAWKSVPSELFVLEADPAKAASDPGYYGREYSFEGDAVVENHTLAAVFSTATGRVAAYSKAGSPASPGGLGKKVWEFAPAGSGGPVQLKRCEVLRNADDEVVLEVFFTGTGATGEVSAVLSFGRNEIVEIKPGGKMNGVRLFGPIEYGVVPGFVGDDLIFNPVAYKTDAVSIPAENIFLSLLPGQDRELVMTWPKGKQQLSLRLAGDQTGGRVIESIDFNPDHQSFYLAALAAPGIWHREELKAGFLEKDTPLSWTRPFPAKWKTQLQEAGVRTTFNFRAAKGTVWRGVPGSYNYPAWFDGDKALLHLSKKVPPKGEALIYFIEGQETPINVSTPADILKETLGRAAAEPILDAAGRKLRTHHRRGGDGVHRACTCGCTEAIQAVFEAGQELSKKDEVKEALGDMNFFVECHVERIEEYQKFATEMIQFLQSRGKVAPAHKSYLEALEQIVQQIPQEYSVQKENMKSADHAAQLTRQTLTLTGSKNPNNLASYMELLKAWRAMGGAQDYVVAQCHMITRKLFQEAGYAGASDAATMAVAQEVRGRCRQVLRNPDGYEIWADY